MAINFLQYLIALEPVNLFLYTWQMIPTLQIEETNRLILLFYFFCYKIEIFILPFNTTCLYFASSLSGALQTIDKYRTDKPDKAIFWHNVNQYLSIFEGFRFTFQNLCSCAILFLTIRHAHKITEKINHGKDNL